MKEFNLNYEQFEYVILDWIDLLVNYSLKTF